MRPRNPLGDPAYRDVLRLHPNFDREFVKSVAPFGDAADLEHLMDGLRKAGWDG